jgi:hypothetical protein
MPLVSRKVLAGLAISTGLGTSAFYFYPDMASFFSESKRQREAARDYEKWSVSSSPSEISNPKTELAIARSVAKAEEARARRKRTEMASEAIRSSTIQALLRAGLLEHKRGATQPYSLTLSTIHKRLAEAGYNISDSVEANVMVQRILADPDSHPKEYALIMQTIDEMNAEAAAKGRAKEGLRRASELRRQYEQERETLERSREDEYPTPQDVLREFADIVVKEMREGKESVRDITIDELTDGFALEVIEQMCDTSQACKSMVEAAVPGHSKYEELNEAVEDLYVAIKRKYGSGGSNVKGKSPTFATFIQKGLTEEQFEQNVREGDIKRGTMGRFSKVGTATAAALTKSRRLSLLSLLVIFDSCA